MVDTSLKESRMDIRNSLDNLKSLLGVSPSAPSATQQKPELAPSALTSDSATLSNAGSEVALTAADSDVRADKVAGIQAALASGSYEVPASAVASKMVDAMLNNKH
jgi:flagellar biosynthesis anti-sigma factor FlgM